MPAQLRAPAAEFDLIVNDADHQSCSTIGTMVSAVE